MSLDRTCPICGWSPESIHGNAWNQLEAYADHVEECIEQAQLAGAL